MSDYQYERKIGSNSSTRGHYGNTAGSIVGVTIHHWGSDGQDHDNVVGWLRGAAGGTSNRRSSAHAVISAGRVTRVVDDDRAAWHSGTNEGNGWWLGFECRPEMSAADWETLVQFCADTEETHGSLKYKGHDDWKATACPGRYSSRIGELVTAVNAEHERRKAGGTKPAPKPPAETPTHSDEAPPYPLDAGEYFGPKSGPETSVSGYYSHREDLRAYQTQMVEVRGWKGLGEIDGLYGPKTSRVTRLFQAEKGLVVDGLIGPKTWAAAWEEPIT